MSKRRTLTDKLAHGLPGARSVFSALGLSTLHDTEFHWHDAPADFDIEDDGTREMLEKQLIAALSPSYLSIFTDD